jgi:predicted metal-dependent hydrolase
MSVFGRSFSDGDRLEVAGAPVTLRVNRRARRVSLRLDRTRREIVATAPSPRRLSEAAAFARERAGWIAQRIAELPDATPIHPGMVLTVFGEPVRLEATTGRARWIAAADGEPARIAAMPGESGGAGEGYARAVILMLKKRALAVLSERTEVYAAMLGVEPPKVTVADAKGRWGSCRPAVRGAAASIRYSWRLALSRSPTMWRPTNAPTCWSSTTGRASGRTSRPWSASTRPTARGCAPKAPGCTRLAGDQCGASSGEGAGSASWSPCSRSWTPLMIWPSASVGCSGGGATSAPGIGSVFSLGRAWTM